MASLHCSIEISGFMSPSIIVNIIVPSFIRLLHPQISSPVRRTIAGIFLMSIGWF
jgi:hypothetical protein